MFLIRVNQTSYSDRLRELNLPTLKYRRMRGNLIQVFKILNGHYDVNSKDFFTLHNERTHDTSGHSKKLVKHRTLTHSCDKFQRGIREVFLSFPGGFSKMYRIYKNILHSFPGDFKILVKSDIF